MILNLKRFNEMFPNNTLRWNLCYAHEAHAARLLHGRGRSKAYVLYRTNIQNAPNISQILMERNILSVYLLAACLMDSHVPRVTLLRYLNQCLRKA